MTEKKFEKINQLIQEERLEEALRQVESLEKKEIDRPAFFQLQILKCSILIKMEQHEQCIQIVQQILQNSNQLEKLERIQLFNKKAEAQNSLANYQEALETINQSIQLLTKMTEEKNVQKLECEAKANFLKGAIFLAMGSFDKALDYTNESLELYQKLAAPEELSNVLNSLGAISIHKGELDRALEFFMKSLKLRRELGIKTLISSSLNNISIVYYYKLELDKMLEHLKEALALSQEMGNKYGIGNAYTNMGNVYLKKGELDQALDYYKKGLKSYQELNSKERTAINSINIGIIYEKKGEFDEALKYLEWSYKTFKEIGNSRYMADALQSMGSIYQIKGDLKKAIQTFKQALALQQEIGNKIVASHTLTQLLAAQIEIGNIIEAKECLEELQSIQKSEENKGIDLRCRLARAMLLKEAKTGGKLSFKRLYEKLNKIVTAIDLLEEIVNEEETINYELTVEAIFNLCELRIFEASSLGNKKSLKQVYDLTKQLVAIGEEQNSYSLLAKTYLLQAHLVALEANISQAQELLKKAEQIAAEKGYDRLAIVIVNEQKRLSGEVFNSFIEEDISFLDRLGKIQLQGLITSIRQNRLEFYAGQQPTKQPTISELTEFSKQLQQRNVQW